MSQQQQQQQNHHNSIERILHERHRWNCGAAFALQACWHKEGWPVWSRCKTPRGYGRGGLYGYISRPIVQWRISQSIDWLPQTAVYSKSWLQYIMRVEHMIKNEGIEYNWAHLLFKEFISAFRVQMMCYRHKKPSIVLLCQLKRNSWLLPPCLSGH